MKKHLFTTAVAILLMAACSQEEMTGNQPEGTISNGTPITITAGINKDPQTRLAYSAGDDDAKVNWSAGAEQFSLVYDGSASEPYLFKKPAGDAPVAKANFTCDNAPTLLAPATIYAIYPGSEDIKGDAPYIAIDLSEQSGKKDDLNRNHLMIATADVYNLSDLDLTFEHKVAVLKLTLSSDDFTEGTVVSGINIEATNLKNKGEYNISGENWNFGGAGANITLTAGAIANAGGKD